MFQLGAVPFSGPVEPNVVQERISGVQFCRHNSESCHYTQRNYLHLEWRVVEISMGDALFDVGRSLS